MYGCVYVCICVSQTRVYENENTHLHHTFSHWLRHTNTQYTCTTYMQRDTCINVPWFIQTHAWVAAYVVLSVWIYVRVYVCVTVCMCVYMYVCIYVCMYLCRTPAHWRRRTIHNTRTQRTCEETHVYTYQNSYTHTPKTAHVVLSVWIVHVYKYLCRTCTHWHRHVITQYMYVTCMERDTCVHVPWFIQTHTWVAAHVVLSVWMCVGVYMCITMHMCVCVYVSVSYIYTLT